MITGNVDERNGKEVDELIVLPTVYTLTVSLALSLLLTVVMADRFSNTEKFMPAGLVALMSCGMSLFYIYKLLTRPEHLPHKKKE